MQIELDTACDGRWVVVRVVGDVDIATVGALDDVFARVRATGSSAVICDLSRVTFFAVAGLHALQRAGADLRAVGVEPHLVVGIAGATMPVLALMIGVCDWPVHDSVESATGTVLSADA